MFFYKFGLNIMLRDFSRSFLITLRFVNIRGKNMIRSLPPPRNQTLIYKVFNYNTNLNVILFYLASGILL